MAQAKTALVGACGEFFVAAYLSGSNLLVALPRAGIPGTDLYVSAVGDGPSIRIQVKTGTQSTKKDKIEGPIYLWYTSFQAIGRVNEYLWYAYVWLKKWPSGDEQPEVYFLPSSVVAECLKTEQEAKVTRSFFWMRELDAQKYKGEAGLKLLMKQLTPVADSLPS